ncbi:hypothetical protein ACFS3C_06245 [Azotobacter vinelandii]
MYRKKVTCLHGRGQAIARLIAGADASDVLLLAGKGHEDYQEINGVRQPFFPTSRRPPRPCTPGK